MELSHILFMCSVVVLMNGVIILCILLSFMKIRAWSIQHHILTSVDNFLSTCFMKHDKIRKSPRGAPNNVVNENILSHNIELLICVKLLIACISCSIFLVPLHVFVIGVLVLKNDIGFGSVAQILWYILHHFTFEKFQTCLSFTIPTASK